MRIKVSTGSNRFLLDEPENSSLQQNKNRPVEAELVEEPVLQKEKTLPKKKSSDAEHQKLDKLEEALVDEENDNDEEKDWSPKMRDMFIPVPGTGSGCECNPVTSLLAIAILFGLVIWCMTDPAGSKQQLGDLKADVTHYFTWLMVGSTPFFLIFTVYVYVVFGNQKLGPKDSTPEFDALSYFAMIFSAGVAVGLFFYGVLEPLYHLSDNRYAAGYHTDDERKNHAILLTVFHWGLSAWVVYVLVGITAGIVAYRDGFPMTMRSCFYPVLGEYTWGFYGDIIDAISIVVVISGVCTSLGLGAIQLVDGIERQTSLELGDDTTSQNNARIIAIWVVTCVATASVVSGLDVGIKFLSLLALFAGLFLWFMVLVLDDTPYLLNVIVSSMGYYFQTGVVEMSFETDGFAQLNYGEGDSIDGMGAYASWMNDWTIFYWAWWTAWASFVGLFIARVSKGRTVRSVIHFTLAGPLVYTFLWFSVFGGAGIRMHSRALELEQLGNKYGVNFNIGRAGEACFDFTAGHNNLIQSDLWQAAVNDSTAPTLEYFMQDTHIGPVCKDVTNDAWWQTMEQYYDLGGFLSWLALFSLAIYFVTSSDSGSLIVDHLASNGRDRHFWMQRVFWAFLEGATATALLVAGKSDALTALQAASIVAGLPYRIILLVLCTSLYRLCTDYKESEHRHFKVPVYGGLFGLLESLAATVTCQKILPNPTLTSISEGVKAIFMPGRSVYIVTGDVKLGVATSVFHVAAILCWIISVEVEGMDAFGWTFYAIMALILTYVRFTFRQENEIFGNFLEDLFGSAIVYFQVCGQLVIEKREVNVSSKETL